MSFAIPIVVAAIAISISVYISDQLSIISENSLRNTGLLRFQPDKFQGSHQTHQYFEGWYYKFVSPLDGNASNNNSSTMSMAVVPGIFYGSTPDSNESHAFIFVTLNGERQHYYRFDIDEFSYASSKKNDEYFIQVGDNRFTHSGVYLNLYPRQGGGGDRITTDDADLVLQGNLTFSHISPWPVTLFRLGAMGPVGWLPGLECRHGVLSFDHVLRGSIYFASASDKDEEGTTISMDEGRGYTEKDYGRSFPTLWVWIQTNSFRKNHGTSLFVSIARIPTPLFGLEFPGFTAAIWHNGSLIPFATWSGAKFEDLKISKDQVYIAMRSSSRHHYDYRVEIIVDRNAPEVLLYAPMNFTKMEPFVKESLRATVHVRLFSGYGEVVMDDIGDYAGLEVHGDVEWLANNLCGKKTANRLICL